MRRMTEIFNSLLLEPEEAQEDSQLVTAAEQGDGAENRKKIAEIEEKHRLNMAAIEERETAEISKIHRDAIEDCVLHALKEFDELCRNEEWEDEKSEYFERILQVFIDFARDNVDPVFARLGEYANFVRTAFRSVCENSAWKLEDDLQSAQTMCASFLISVDQENNQPLEAGYNGDDIFAEAEKMFTTFYSQLQQSAQGIMSSPCLPMQPQVYLRADTDEQSEEEEKNFKVVESSSVTRSVAEEDEQPNTETPNTYDAFFAGMWATMADGAQKLASFSEQLSGMASTEEAKDIYNNVDEGSSARMIEAREKSATRSAKTLNPSF